MINLGFFAMPLHPHERDYQKVIAENREAVILADRLGFSEAWIGEHYTSVAEPIPDPWMFFASALHETKSIRFGTAVLNLPYHHPVRLGIQIAMFDQISNGRAMVGIGPGGLVSDTEIFGIDRDKGYAMMLECVDMMVALWTTNPPYDLKGEFWNLALDEAMQTDIGVGRLPKPVQKPHPPIAYAMRSPKSGSARTMAERDWIPISGNFIPSGHIKSQWEDYAAHRQALGKRPDPENWRAARSILVTESDAQAQEYLDRAETGFRHYFSYLRTLEMKREIQDLSSLEFQAQLSTRVNEALEDQVIAGSADTVLDKLVAFREETGPFGTLLMTGHDWDDADLWRSSMHRLAEDVMPRLNQHAAA